MTTNKNIFSVITVFFIAIFCNTVFAQVKKDSIKTKALITTSEFKNNTRQLWEEHIFYTRNVIFCIVDNLPGKEEAIKRLLKNQAEIGNSIMPYYGTVAGKYLTQLLYKHVNLSIDVINAAKEENTLKLMEVNKKWYANADDIAKFLNKQNADFFLQDLKNMMEGHLKLTTDEVVQRIKKNYTADIITTNKLEKDILKMADMLADGISFQHPEKFIKL